MRTTINLDDAVHLEMRRLAGSRSLPLGKIVSHILRRGLAAQPSTRKVNGLLVFDLPADSPTVTTKSVQRLEDEGA